VNCEKIAEPIEMPFGKLCGLGWVQGSTYSMAVHIITTYRIRFNRPRAAAMRPLSNYFDHLLLMGVAANKEVKTTFCDAWFVSDDIDTGHSD